MSDPKEFPRDPDQARLDIELTRKELGDTAQALAHKLDVPARAKEQAQERAAQVKSQLRHGTQTVRGNPVPLLVICAVAAVAVGGLITWRNKR
ncbi:DUF3618 domain-containing protein [Prauserella cavernicola]|uniref:DUF3618 domain-containing protein n=1 Tax=Prauserella cavernicola TaxID=2800127 RepID=A0A934QVW0_9PSEU|nr:DUF3618 domain-containing protein [Prauserella cavernicola]MBK1786284.1 DUF3618 domain-containing protein [Prauserella cavernicola]